MKKIKLIFASLFALVVVLSCNDDGGDSKLNLQTGAVPDIRKVEGSSAIINLQEIQEGNEISISFSTKIAQGNVSSINIIAFYFKGEDFEKVTLAENVTTFPLTITLSKQDLIDKFSLLNADEDFILGDRLRVSADIVLADGTAVKLLNDDGSQNFGPDISNASLYNVSTTYIVSCPSDLGGEFAFTTTNVGEPGGGTVAGPLTGTVTFTDNGGGNYSVSDASFGGWLGLYGPGANDTAQGVALIDICGNLSFDGLDQFDETFFIEDVVVDGSNLSFHWSNDYGEYGDTTLTRTDGTEWPPLVAAE